VFEIRAFDDIIALGYRANINFAQIFRNVEIDPIKRKNIKLFGRHKNAMQSKRCEKNREN